MKLRRVSIIGTAAAAVLATTIAPASAVYEHSHGVHRSNWTTFDDGALNPGQDEWTLSAKIDYTYTKRVPGHDRIEGPYWVRVHYNREGKHQKCSKWWPGHLQAVRADLYFSDPHGRNFHRQIDIPCDSDTTNGVVVQYKGEHLYTDGDSTPKVKVVWTIRKSGLNNDASTHFGIALRGKDGQGMERVAH